MSYQTEEQQLEVLKDWWKENGAPLIVGAVLGLAGFGGWKYWNMQQIAYQENASDLYSQVTEIATSDDLTGLGASAMAVKANYPESSYAVLAVFHLVKLAIEAGDLDKAAAELNWILKNHSDSEMANIAKIRLARILIEQDKAAEAVKMATFEEDSGYYALASVVKGDALLALDKKDQALMAYKAASADLAIAARHPNLQFKIDALSEQPPVIALNDSNKDANTKESVADEPVADKLDDSADKAATSGESGEQESAQQEAN